MSISPSPVKPSPPESLARWSAPVVALHWLGAAAILFLLALGLAMTHADLDAALKFDLYQLHKAVGWLTLVLTLARLAARALTRAPAPLAASPMWERAAARVAHVGLYALALAVAASGWVRVSTAIVPVPISLFGLTTIPDIAAMDLALSETMARLHALAAYGLAALIALHAAAAIKHGFADRDGAWRRMAFGRGQALRSRSRLVANRSRATPSPRTHRRTPWRRDT